MKIKITKAVAVISIVSAALGIALCAAGAAGNGSIGRVFKNMGGKIYYYDNRGNDKYDIDDYYDDFFDDDIEDFFNEFNNMYGGGNGNEASL